MAARVRTINAMMLLERLQHGIPDRVTGGPAVQQDQRRSVAGNTVMQVLAVVGEKAVHADQPRLPINSM